MPSKKISELPVIANPDGTELIPVVRNGVNSVITPTASKLVGPAKTQVDSIGLALRKQGWSVISTLSMTPGEATLRAPTISGSRKGGLTAVVKEVSPVSVSAIKFVHANWIGFNLDAFVPAANDILVADSAVDADGRVYAARYGADGRLGRVHSRTFRISDEVPIKITANTPYTCREFAGVESNIGTVPTFIGLAFNSLYSQPNGGDSAGPEDSTQTALTSADRTNALTVHLHTAVLGFTGATPAKSLVIYGDSISAALHDAGAPYNGMGGVGVRVAINGITPDIQWPVATPNFGYIATGHSGARLVDFLAIGGNQGPMELGSFATTAWTNFGINDLITGRTLAQLKADTLTLAGFIAAAGQKHIVQTLFPQTSSTDAWTTATGQTVTSFEADRVAFNSWLRDTSASGFIAQAKVLYPTYRGAIFDVCTYCEVNAAGVLTLNGGRWKQPTGAAAFTGSVTAGAGTKTSFTDSAMTAAANTHRGRAIRWLTGANAGTVTGITYQRSNGQYGVSGTPNNITTGDTYEVWADIATKEGVHPLSSTLASCASAFVTNYISLVE
jgi:hypothetical protein